MKHINISTQNLRAASWLTHDQARWLHSRGARVIYTRERGWHVGIVSEGGRLFQDVGLTPRCLCGID